MSEPSMGPLTGAGNVLVAFVDFHDPTQIDHRRAVFFFEGQFKGFKDHFLYWKKKSPIGPVVVSVLRVPGPPVIYRALTFEYIEVPEQETSISFWRSSLGIFPAHEDLFRCIQQKFARANHFRSDRSSVLHTPFHGGLQHKLSNLKAPPFGDSDFFYLPVTQPVLDLQRKFDDKIYNVSLRMKFGVLYQKVGQTDEKEMFGNCDGSPEYEEFLAFLGKRIPLKGFTGYSGGLDTELNLTGTESVVGAHGPVELMFHVSTLLPLTKDPQQIDRKRHIGNDNVAIVFQDAETLFTADSIVTHMTLIYFIIRPEVSDSGERNYRLSFIHKPGVGEYGPPLNSEVYPKNDEFREFLYSKLCNAQLSVLHSPELASRNARSNMQWLEDHIAQLETMDGVAKSS